MDKNKLKVLQDIGYTIKRVCSNCVHNLFKGTNDFGTCLEIEYEHLKHTQSIRNLSIHKQGCCSKHEFNLNDLSLLGSYEQFVEK